MEEFLEGKDEDFTKDNNINDNIYNYRGYFGENEEDEEKKFN